MKQKKQIVVLAVLLLILVVVGYFYFDSDKPVVTADAGSGAQKYTLLPVDNLSLRTGPVEKARKTDYKSSGRNIFSPVVPPPVPTKAEIDQAKKKREEDLRQQTLLPPPPPQVSKLPVKFFGYGTVPNGTARLAFFSDTDNEVIIVKEGELLMNRFRIIKINNANLDYEEVSSGLRGSAPLEDQGGPPSA
jgi:hypothetical protein